MNETLAGLHHITCIAGSAQSNVDFYAGTMGLRLVKQTVNFDDPGSYHFYYGDANGSPGTLVTFFAWPVAEESASTRAPHHAGFRAGQLAAVTLSAAPKTLDFWRERLGARGVPLLQETRFGESVLRFHDGDGTPLEIIESASETRDGFSNGASTVPREYSLRGLHSAALCEEGFERSAELLTETMGFAAQEIEGARHRYICGEGGAGRIAELLCVPDAISGRSGFAPGVIHHVAWRARDDAAQMAWRAALVRRGLNVSPVMDRSYFRSIYFREPGGVLFEIATDAPGFATDESAENLGTTLQLPPQFEPHRAQLETVLPPLRVAETAR